MHLAIACMLVWIIHVLQTAYLLHQHHFKHATLTAQITAFSGKGLLDMQL